MILWRISNHFSLDGEGGLRGPGRWHNTGVPIVYLSEHPALAMLETLVNFNLDFETIPENYQLLKIEHPDESDIMTLDPLLLTAQWQQDRELTRALGDSWIASGASVLLKIPSAVIPAGYNYLFNPRHSAAGKTTLLESARYPYDPRLWLIRKG